MNVCDMTVAALSALLRKREISAVETANAFLARIAERDGLYGAFLTTTADLALRQAARADARLASGENVTSLTGVPFAVKDNICVKGVRTTCGSRILSGYIAPYDAFAARRLLDGGAVLLGKTNMDEFGMGASTTHSAFQITRNPADPDRIPGGSSGGSAAAVAAGEAAFALGSDTGGSVRQPAAFCGAVGLKPTYGAVSRRGLVAFASSLDQIGPLTRCVGDAALVFDAIAGHDDGDATSARRRLPPLADAVGREVSGMRAGLPRELLGDGIDPQIREAVLNAARRLASLGVRVEETSLPALTQTLGAYYVISSAEASSNLARYDGVRYGRRAENCPDAASLYVRSRSEGFGDEVKRRILLGTFVLSAGFRDAYYQRAVAARARVRRDFDRAFADFDFLLAPTAPTAAPRFDETPDDPVRVYAGDVCTVPANLAGLPAMSVPFGKTPDGRPAAVQLIGPAFGEEVLIAAGHALEQEAKA